MNDASRVAAIVLAAGVSRRMGRPKLLLPIHGTPLVRIMVERVFAAGMDPVVVVVSSDDPGVRAALRGLPVTFAVNDDIGGPTSGSLHAGLDLVPASCDGALVILPDMPHVTTAMMQSVAERGCDPELALAVSRYGGVSAPPLFFPRRLFAELREWNGDGCGKQVVRRHEDEAIFCEWPETSLADLDTPDEYQRFLSHLEPDPSPIDRGWRPT